MSIEMSGSTVSKSWFASCLTSSVLPTPVGPTKIKLAGAVAAGQVGAGALDGTGHGVDSLVLPDDVCLKGILQPLRGGHTRSP